MHSHGSNGRAHFYDGVHVRVRARVRRMAVPLSLAHPAAPAARVREARKCHARGSMSSSLTMSMGTALTICTAMVTTSDEIKVWETIITL